MHNDVEEWLWRNYVEGPRAAELMEPIAHTKSGTICYGSNWDGVVLSKYRDSDELLSLDGSSDEERIRRPRHPSFNEKNKTLLTNKFGNWYEVC